MSLKRNLVLGIAVVLGALLPAAPAEAQTRTNEMRLVNYGNAGTINTTRYGTVRASPYQGYFVGGPTTPLIDFFCIDFEHYAPALGYDYNVRITELGLGNISQTRHGMEAGALAKYQQVAWLIAQRTTVNADAWRAIQLAIWQTFSGTCEQTTLANRACARNGDAYLNALAASWRTQAGLNYQNMSYSGYKIATGYGADGSRQEYMYVTPEPETYALLGMGLLTLLVTWYRRRRREDEPAFATGLAGI
jgi:hypothetical protein